LKQMRHALSDPRKPGQYFRQRKGNSLLHQWAFLEAVGGADTALHRELIGFFRATPLWLDLPELRVVHARWSTLAVASLERCDDASGYAALAAAA
jgi:hypothetical protein